MSWRRLEKLLVATVVALYQLCPVEQRYAGAFGHPKREKEKGHIGEITLQLQIHITTVVRKSVILTSCIETVYCRNLM